MSFLSLFTSGTSVSSGDFASRGTLTSVSEGVSFALRGSSGMNRGVSSFSDDDDLITKGVKWIKSWLGFLPEQTPSVYESLMESEEIQSNVNPIERPVEQEIEVVLEESRQLQTSLPTEISATNPATFEMTRLQADAISGNGTYGKVISTFLNGKALPQGMNASSYELTLTSKYIAPNVKLLTGFNPDGFALAGRVTATTDTFYLVDKNLTVLGNGTFSHGLPSLGGINRYYLLENQTLSTLYSWSVSAPAPVYYNNYARIDQFALNAANSSLYKTGSYNASELAGIRQFGDPTLKVPKTCVLNSLVNGTSNYVTSIGQWGINLNNSMLEVKSQMQIAPGFTVSSKLTLDEETLIVSWVANTGFRNGQLDILRVSSNGSFVPQASILANRGLIVLSNSGLYLQDETPSVCRYTYEGEKLNCASASGLLFAQTVQSEDLYFLSSGAIKIFDSASLSQTAQLTLPGVTSVDAAFPTQDGSIFFSSAGSVYRVKNSVPTGTLGMLWNTTVPAFVAYGLTPGATNTLSVNFTAGSPTAYSYTPSFIVKPATAMISPNCSFSFTQPLGTSANFDFAVGDCVEDPDQRMFTMQSETLTSELSVQAFVPKVSLWAVSGLNLTNTQIFQIEKISGGLFSFSTSGSAIRSNVRILNVDESSASQNIYLGEETNQFTNFVLTKKEELFCFDGISATIDQRQQNLTTLCAEDNDLAHISLRSSSVIPLGNGGSIDYLSSTFNRYKLPVNLGGWKTYNFFTNTYYWAVYNLTDPINPTLIPGTGTLGYPSTTPQNLADPLESFSYPSQISEGLFINENGAVFQWESPFNPTNPRWEKLSQLPIPALQSSAYAYGSLYTMIEGRFVAYIATGGVLNVWDLLNSRNPIMVGNYGGFVQYSSLSFSPDQTQVAVLDNTHKISVFSVKRFQDGTFGFALLSDTQTPSTGFLNQLLWRGSEIVKIPLGQTSPTLYRITPANGRWDAQYRVTTVVNSLNSKTYQIPLTDGLGRTITLPFTVKGTPLSVIPTSSALQILGDKKYGYMLSFGGQTVFSPGLSTPKFDIDLNALFRSPNTAYVDTHPSFFFQEATIPSYVTVFDRGGGKYSLQIVGGIFPAQAVNQRPDGSPIENAQEIILQVGDTLGSSGIDLHLVIQIRGNTPSMKKPFQVQVLTHQEATTSLPAVVTGLNSHGFSANTDGLDTCYEGRYAPSWVTVECDEVTTITPPNSVGTTTFELRPRTYIPGTGQLVGVGDWQTATIVNSGQGYGRPLGELFPVGSAPRVKVGVSASVSINAPASIFRISDGLYESALEISVSGASRLNQSFSASEAKLNLTVLSPSTGTTVTLKATQPWIFAAPETASVSAGVAVDPSLESRIVDDVSLTAGTLGSLPIEVSTPSLTETVDISLTFSPITGSALNSQFQLPSEFEPYLDSRVGVGSVGLKQVPVGLLTKMSEENGLSRYQLPLQVKLAENQNVYWNADLTVQDYQAGLPLNTAKSSGLTLVVQEKPVAAEADVEAVLLSTDQLTRATTTQVRLDGLFVNSAGGKASYTLSSSDPTVVKVEPRNEDSVFGKLSAQSPGEATITACLINRFNLTTCATPQKVTVPAPIPTPQAQSGSADQTASFGSIGGVAGTLLTVVAFLGPIYRSMKAQQKQAEKLIAQNLERKAARRRQLGNLALDDHTAVRQAFDHIDLITSREIKVGGETLISLTVQAFKLLLQVSLEKSSNDQTGSIRMTADSLRDAIGGVRTTGNSVEMVHKLQSLLYFTTLMAATRVDIHQSVPYDWRLNFLQWVDDQASLLKGREAADLQAKALLKLIRYTLQPLQTNETLPHYIKRHITDLLVMMARYLKSRKHQGKVEETTEVIDGVIALVLGKEDPAQAEVAGKRLTENKDWRLKILGVMILGSKAENSTALIQAAKPISMKSRRCCRSSMPKSHRPSLVAASLMSRSASEKSVEMKGEMKGEMGQGSPVVGLKWSDNPINVSQRGRRRASVSPVRTRDDRVKAIQRGVSGGSPLPPPPPPPRPTVPGVVGINDP